MTPYSNNNLGAMMMSEEPTVGEKQQHPVMATMGQEPTILAGAPCQHSSETTTTLKDS